jgi:hypothetical protein
MPILKFLNGDLYLIDQTPVSVDYAIRQLIKEGLVTSDQITKLIDPETSETLDIVDLIEGDTIYPVLVQNPLTVKWLNPKRFDRMHWSSLSAQSYATPFLFEHSEFIDYQNLCRNPHPLAIETIEALIKDNRMKPEFWVNLNENPGAVHLFCAHPDKVNWDRVLRHNRNPSIMEVFLEKVCMDEARKLVRENNVSCFAHPDAVPYIKMFENEIADDSYFVYLNPSPAVSDFIISRVKKFIERDHLKMVNLMCRKTLNQQALDEIVQAMLSDEYLCKKTKAHLNMNPLAIPYLKAHPELINWTWLSDNPSAEAVKMIEEEVQKNLGKNHSVISSPINGIDWCCLAKNPHAISLLEKKNLSLDIWRALMSNPHPRALEIISKGNQMIDYHILVGNPGVFLTTMEEYYKSNYVVVE